MNAMTHTGNFDYSFAVAVAEADLDAEIAVYKADLASEAARPDYIVYSRIRGGFVYGSESGVYDSNTAADIARSAPIPTPTPMPGPGDFDESDSALCGCGKPAGGWHHNVQSGTCLHLRHEFVAVAPIPTPTPPPTPAEIDDGDSALCTNCGIDICTACNVRWHRGRGLLVARAPRPTPPPTPAEIDAECANCGNPAHEWCDECDLDVCVTCSPRFHRHGQPATSRRNGAAFFGGQRAVAAFRKSTIESHLDRARRHAAELHGDLGDAGYSEHVQAEADALFN